MIKLTRQGDGPILSPGTNDWEDLVRTNPGAWHEDGTTYLLYRASGTNESCAISFGLAVSKDGVHFEPVSDEPVFRGNPGNWDAGGVEDARIIKFGDTFYITYAARPAMAVPYWRLLKGDHSTVEPVACPADAPWLFRQNATATALAMTKDFRSYVRAGRITRATVDDRDVIIFPEKVGGKYVMVHRPHDWVGPDYGTDQPGIWIAFSDDLLSWPHSRLLATAEQPWEQFKIGANAPPIRTDRGWLMLYHGVTDQIVYRVGAMLLDLEDPTQILARTAEPILEPKTDYERNGVVDNVVFPCGNVVIDGTLHVYYGAADKYCGVATADLHKFVDSLTA